MKQELAPCPQRMNCVSSRPDAAERHRIAPLAVTGDAQTTLSSLRSLLENWPRTRIVTASRDYLHAECRSRLGFVDDVEFQLCPDDNVIHMRACARFGYYDLGVNRERIEKLRDLLENGMLDCTSHDK